MYLYVSHQAKDNYIFAINLLNTTVFFICDLEDLWPL